VEENVCKNMETDETMCGDWRATYGYVVMTLQRDFVATLYMARINACTHTHFYHILKVIKDPQQVGVTHLKTITSMHAK
jgi:hypothetical protein